MSKYWSAVVRELTPYIPGEQPKIANLVKLNTNENPYGPSPKVLEALRGEVSDSLRLYPDPNSDLLKVAIADFHKVHTNQVFVGNGSDEVLAHSFQALLKHELPLLFPDVTYSFYPVYCGLYDIEYVTIPLSDSFEINVADYLKPNGGIIFPNPNAPTGRLLPLESIENLLKLNTESVVVIDEAYVDFGGESAISLVNKYPQLLVTCTLSKARSLAGLRVGYAIGNTQLIDALHRVKDSFNSYPLDRFAIAGAIAAMNDVAYFEETRKKVIRSRESLVVELAKLGFETIPSGANFIFTKHPMFEGAHLTSELRSRGVLVRHFKSPVKISQYLRISIGTEQECELLVKALIDIIK